MSKVTNALKARGTTAEGQQIGAAWRALRVCADGCGSLNAKMQPCPYNSEILGDWSEVPLCPNCYDLRCDEL